MMYFISILVFLVPVLGSMGWGSTIHGVRSWSAYTSRTDVRNALLRLRGGEAGDDVNCKDGVCTVDGNKDSKGEKSALEKVMEVENEGKNEGIATLEGLGYSREDAERALKQSAGSVEAAGAGQAGYSMQPLEWNASANLM